MSDEEPADRDIESGVAMINHIVRALLNGEWRQTKWNRLESKISLNIHLISKLLLHSCEMNKSWHLKSERSEGMALNERHRLHWSKIERSTWILAFIQSDWIGNTYVGASGNAIWMCSRWSHVVDAKLASSLCKWWRTQVEKLKHLETSFRSTRMVQSTPLQR